MDIIHKTMKFCGANNLTLKVSENICMGKNIY